MAEPINALLHYIFSRLSSNITVGAVVVTVVLVVGVGLVAWLIIGHVRRSRGLLIVLLFLGVFGVGVGGSIWIHEPSIFIMEPIPPFDLNGGEHTHADIHGKVEWIIDPSKYKVVIYVKTSSWFVQPEIATPMTDIGTDLRWENWTHTGSNYAAILVKKPYPLLSATLNALPAISGNIIAITKVEGKR